LSTKLVHGLKYTFEDEIEKFIRKGKTISWLSLSSALVVLIRMEKYRDPRD